MRRYIVRSLLVAVLVAGYVSAITPRDDKATVAFPADLVRDCESINTQITLLIERRDRLVLQAQINAGLGRDYQIDYAAMAWRLKAPAASEQKEVKP